MENRRIWVFYTFNSQDRRKVVLANGDTLGRVDVVGDLAVRHSDDGGRTWSPRQTIELPRTEIDRENGFTLFWISGYPQKIGNTIYIGISKGGGSWPDQTEGFLLATNDPEDNQSWRLWPSGDHGFTAPGGSPIAEEPSFTEMPNGGIYVVYRTNTGRLANAVSTDDGKTWKIGWARHVDGRVVSNPRAKASIGKLSRRRYILWFHNNKSKGFKNRNPVWYSCGEFTDDTLLWGTPKVLIYDPNPKMRISYPSFLDIGIFLGLT